MLEVGVGPGLGFRWVWDLALKLTQGLDLGLTEPDSHVLIWPTLHRLAQSLLSLTQTRSPRCGFGSRDLNLSCPQIQQGSELSFHAPSNGRTPNGSQLGLCVSRHPKVQMPMQPLAELPQPHTPAQLFWNSPPQAFPQGLF